MEIEVKLFGNMGHYLPEGADRFSFKRSLDEGATVQDLLKELKIPETMPVLAMISGQRVEPTYALKDRDDVALYSPAAGG